MNTVQLIGRWVRDPELRYSATGTAVANGTLAVNRRFKKDEADFIRVVMFKQTAEAAANYTKKGSLVGVTGTIQTGSYEKDGQKVFTTDVIADNLEFLDPKGSSTGQSNQNNNTRTDRDPFANDGQPINITDDDLPF